jgi:hypothetical protein
MHLPHKEKQAHCYDGAEGNYPIVYFTIAIATNLQPHPLINASEQSEKCMAKVSSKLRTFNPMIVK